MRRPPRPRALANPGPVLVLAAWDPELQPLRDALPSRTGDESVVLRTVGVGLIEAALGAARAVAEVAPREVFLLGSAGVYPRHARRLPIASVAVAGEIVLASSAVAAARAYLPAPMPALAEAPPGPLRRARRAAPRVVRVACPLGITRSAALAGRVATSSQAELENLEAFAVARAAMTAGVPWTVLLGVSNVVGPRAHQEWRAHAGAALAAATAVALRLLPGEHTATAPTPRRRPAAASRRAPRG